MRVIPPITIDSTVLTSSTIAEPTIGIDPDIWDPLIPYIVGNRVLVLSSHKIYECIVNVTGGDSPNISITRAVPKWVEVGSTNKWAMFDLYRNTPTVSPNTEMNIILLASITDTILGESTGTGYLGSPPIGTEPIGTEAGSTTFTGYDIGSTSATTYVGPDSLALLNMSNVSSVRIKALSTSDSVIRYDETYDLTNRDTTTWWTYFYTTFVLQTDLVIFDLPISIYGELSVEITLTGSSGMSIGSCVLGTNTLIGNIQRGNTVDAINFSSIERDTFGNAFMVQRRSIPKTSQRIFIDKSRLNTLLALRRDLVATPAVWIGTEDINDPYFTALLVVGYYTDLSFQIDNPIGPLISLELEEI